MITLIEVPEYNEMFPLPDNGRIFINPNAISRVKFEDDYNGRNCWIVFTGGGTLDVPLSEEDFAILFKDYVKMERSEGNESD